MIQVGLFSGNGPGLTDAVNEFLKNIDESNIVDVKVSSSSDAEGKRVNAYTDILVVYKK